MLIVFAANGFFNNKTFNLRYFNAINQVTQLGSQALGVLTWSFINSLIQKRNSGRLVEKGKLANTVSYLERCFLNRFVEFPKSKLWLVRLDSATERNLAHSTLSELDDGLLAWYGLSHSLISFRNRIRFGRSLNFGIALACIVNFAAAVLGITMPSTVSIGTTDGTLQSSATASKNARQPHQYRYFQSDTRPFPRSDDRGPEELGRRCWVHI